MISCVVRMTGRAGFSAMTWLAHANPPDEVRQSIASSSHSRPPARKMCAVLYPEESEPANVAEFLNRCGPMFCRYGVLPRVSSPLTSWLPASTL